MSQKRRGRALGIHFVRWGIVGFCLLLIAYGVWLVVTDAPSYRFVVRLFEDKLFLKQVLREWGVLAPLVFITLQALQVIIAPIPGEATGFLGGYLFGEAIGLIYSTIGLTVGSLVAFGVGRWFGAHYVQRVVSSEVWNKLDFIIEAEGAILCFIIYLIPGLPKDIVCYLFGIQPDAVLGFRRGVDPRPHPRHLGALGAGSAYRQWQLP